MSHHESLTSSCGGLWQTIGFWFRIGCISFGGPAGQIALLHHELVDRRRWIDESRFLHAVNFCMALPGPEAQQLAIYCGWLLHGIPGGILAGSLFILPSLFMLSGLGWVYLSFGSLEWVQSGLDGIRPVVIALVAFAAFRLSRKVLKTPFLGMLAAASFLALIVGHLGYPWVLAGAIATGLLVGRRWRHHLVPGKRHAHATSESMMSRQTGRFTLPFILLAGLLLWWLPMAVSQHFLGSPNLLSDLGSFFTQAALLAFGGAYALLPYVSEAMVDQHGWLSRHEVIDSLALGETTPGPLIMIFSFMGYIVAAKSEVLVHLPAPLPGFIGATFVTWYTFLPSFVMVLAGAPLSERLRQHSDFEAVLAAISAAVVGVILSLGVYLGTAVLGPSGGNGMNPILTTALTVSAFALLARGRITPHWAVVAGAMIGIGAGLIR